MACKKFLLNFVASFQMKTVKKHKNLQHIFSHDN